MPRCAFLYATDADIEFGVVGALLVAVYDFDMADGSGAAGRDCDLACFGGNTGFGELEPDTSMRSTITFGSAPVSLLLGVMLMGKSSCMDFETLVSFVVDCVCTPPIPFISLLPICLDMVVIFADDLGLLAALDVLDDERG